MQLTTEQLDTIEEMAKHFLQIKEIAYIIEEDETELLAEIDDAETKAHKRFYKGYLLEKANQRKAVLELAKGGSAPAQAMAKSYIDELNASL
jgi:hypothetical protein